MMFHNCVHLTRAPELPATKLSGGPYSSPENSGPYHSMFAGCSSLVKAPSILPAAYVSESAYFNMFRGCPIEASPVLPAQNPGADAYAFMFQGCKALKQITCYARTNIGANGATRSWVSGVPAGGTFISDTSVSWPEGVHGIPEGWNGFVEWNSCASWL